MCPVDMITKGHDKTQIEYNIVNFKQQKFYLNKNITVVHNDNQYVILCDVDDNKNNGVGEQVIDEKRNNELKMFPTFKLNEGTQIIKDKKNDPYGLVTRLQAEQEFFVKPGSYVIIPKGYKCLHINSSDTISGIEFIVANEMRCQLGSRNEIIESC